MAYKPAKAAVGRTLGCLDWPHEAALRCLNNNLHPAVAEEPEQLIVYGGPGPRAGGARMSPGPATVYLPEHV